MTNIPRPPRPPLIPPPSRERAASQVELSELKAQIQAKDAALERHLNDNFAKIWDRLAADSSERKQEAQDAAAATARMLKMQANAEEERVRRSRADPLERVIKFLLAVGPTIAAIAALLAALNHQPSPPVPEFHERHERP